MARKVGFGDGSRRRSVLGRDRAGPQSANAPSPDARPDPHAAPPEPGPEPDFAHLATPGAGAGGRFGMVVGMILMLAVPAAFAIIGAWPMLGALSFPDRALEAEARITGRSSVTGADGTERPTAYMIEYATQIGARLSSRIPADRPRAPQSRLVVYYDPDDPRYVRLDREVDFAEALDRVGDRIYFAYFALGFMALTLVMLIAFYARGGRRRPR